MSFDIALNLKAVEPCRDHEGEQVVDDLSWGWHRIVCSLS
jgi:hypothetical protein